MLNALTVDFEEWFTVSNFAKVISRDDWANLESRIDEATRKLLDLFARYNVKATFFMLGWVAEKHPQLVKLIAEKGHELASHSYGHQLVYDLTPAQFKTDLAQSIDIIQQITGVACKGYRAPSFSLRTDMTWAWEILTEQGIEYDSSIFPVRHHRYGEPQAPRKPYMLKSGDVTIREFPLSTLSIVGKNIPVAGGGYLRLYPHALTKWAIKRINQEGHPAIIYLHPWEIDPGQPKPAVSKLTLLRHRVGMHSLLNRLDNLISNFQFAPITQILAGTL